MRKRILSMVLVVILAFGTCGAALAADETGAATGNKLESYGKIEFRDGDRAVVIDSADLYQLADRIDSFKNVVVKQLGEMKTHFTTDGGISLTTDTDIYITHTEPAAEDAVDPADMSFETIKEGIAASQSITSNVTDYGYPEGTELYKKADGELTADGSAKGAEKICVTAATADNLSAGTAAWVNGELVLGKGTDNKVCMEEGYKRGLEESTPGDIKRSINLKANGNRYVVPENVTGGLVYVEHKESIPQISFSSPDGTAVPYTLIFSRSCSNDSGRMHRNGGLYYIPRIKANTVITVSDPNYIADFMYFKK